MYRNLLLLLGAAGAAFVAWKINDNDQAQDDTETLDYDLEEEAEKFIELSGEDPAAVLAALNEGMEDSNNQTNDLITDIEEDEDIEEYDENEEEEENIEEYDEEEIITDELERLEEITGETASDCIHKINDRLEKDEELLEEILEA